MIYKLLAPTVCANYISQSSIYITLQRAWSQLNCLGSELLVILGTLEITNMPLQCFPISPVDFLNGILFSYREKNMSEYVILH